MRTPALTRIQLRSKRKKRHIPGAAPGLIVVSDDARKPLLSITSFGPESLREQPLNTLSEAVGQIAAYPQLTHWIEVRGFADKLLLEEICSVFNIHPLEMEDVVNTYQRPKMEEHDDHLFIISRFLWRRKEDGLHNDQCSIFLMKNLVISMQDFYNDPFAPVRTRLRSGKGQIRNGGSGYLAYALLDNAVDSYFPLLENIGDQLDELEDALFGKPSREHMQRIQLLKRELITFRRTTFAERDKVNDLLRTTTPYINDATKLFLKDTYDHTIQVMDLVESYKEITASLMDIYLSSISYRLNQIMKVLAIISTIFIPLTFIVGVYGMNFSAVDPVNGKVYPLNMPELHSPYGYIGVWAFMIILVVLQLVVFWRKGWLSKN